MLYKSSNLPIEYENFDNNSISEYTNSHNLNSNEFLPTDFKYLNQNEINYNINLSNYSISPSILSHNYKGEKEFGNLNKKEKPINKDINRRNKELLTSENSKKNIIFTTIYISQNKELKKNILKNKKKFGRKKKEDISKRGHNKYSDDNLRRKCKHLVLKNFIDFINDKMERLYKENIGNNIFIKKFLTFNKTQKAESSIPYNKMFLKKTLKEICSDTISSRFTSYKMDHNKNLINTLLNEQDVEKRSYFKNVFDKTFLDCLKHFRGSNHIEEFKGMKCFKDIKEEFKDDKEYIEIINYHLNNFEEIINTKKSRKSKKNNIWKE